MTAHRSGTYVLQPTGYRAFMPARLPPKPSVEMSDALNTALSRADRALGRLDGSIETLLHPELFLSMFVRREAVLSSQIEGTQASLSDVLRSEAALEPSFPSDVREVNNYIAAVGRGVELLEALPISTRLICSLHEILMDDVRGQHQRPGEIRTSQNWIGPEGCGLKDALFVPPPPSEIGAALGDLENFIHDDSPLPPLVRAGLIHGQFETIHPFLDGNGRIGRLLITLFLVEKTILRKPVLYLSYYFKRHRREYYSALQGIRDNGDWETWLLFFLEGVGEVANLAAQTAQKVLRLREDDRMKIILRFDRAAATPLRIIDDLYKLPVTTPNMISQTYDVSYPTANNIIAGLVEIGILQEMTGQKRNRLFYYMSYYSMFEEL